PAGGNFSFNLGITYTPSAMKHTRDSTVSATQSGQPRHWLSEESGNFTLTPQSGGDPLRFPIIFPARPASEMTTTQTSLNLGSAPGALNLNLTGIEVRTGNNFPTDEISIATPFELQEISPIIDPFTASGSGTDLDLQSVGVRSNFSTAGSLSNTIIQFGVSTYGDWQTPNQVTFRIFIDTDRDGMDDFEAFNTSFPNEQGAPSDVFFVRLRNLKTGAVTSELFLNSVTAAQYNTQLFNTNVMVLPVRASSLGLTQANARFNYRVETYIGSSSSLNAQIDQSRTLSFDPTKPGLSFGANSIFFDLNGGTIPVNYNLNDFRANGSEGALILHHHNTQGNRAQILPSNLGREGDVDPRPGGNGSNTIFDWTQVGRFVAGLDDVNLGNEFQRADSAPRSTLGNGSLTVTDWGQAGRYAAGLDTVPSAGGPVTPTSGSSQFSPNQTAASPGSEAGQTRTLRALNASFVAGQTNSLEIELNALGGENAAAFSLNFDPSALSFVSAQTGSAASGAMLLVNTAQAASGRVGIALALPAGQGLQAGARRIVTVRFNVATGSSANTTPVSFGDQIVTRQIANVNADALTASYANAVATIVRAVASVSAASFTGASLAPESIVAAFGLSLATRVEVANILPLPTTLAGTTVKVKDSAGVERLAPLFFVAPGQINFLIPPGTASGAAMITITSGAGAVSMGNVNIAAVTPGLFAANANGQGVAAAVALRFKANGTQSFEPVSRFDPALNRFVPVPIDLGPESDQVFLILFGTGIRFRSALPAVSLQLGGSNHEVLYAGPQGDFAGLDQVNARLSRSLIGRGEIDVRLTADGQTANILGINVK
ncbi:MAG: cohesin domain-containing protein, partial [Blastocatellia bacterium]